MTAAEIRPAGPADAPFLQQMLVAAAFWRPDGPAGSVAEVMDRPEFAHYIAGWPAAGDLGVVADDPATGEPIGAAWLRYLDPADPGYGFVDAQTPELTIGVTAPARGRGIGDRLLAALLERARDGGIAAVSLSVEADNPAVRLYRRHGFEPVGGTDAAPTMLRRLASLQGMSSDRRLLLVHAHPDDETITTGVTIAAHVAAGDQVTVVTCTLGEEGEILLDDLQQLASPYGDQLGGHRMHEMAAAMRALGVTDQRFLGGPGRYRDSGMLGWPANDRLRAFWRADADPAIFDDAADRLAAIVRALRPQVVVTYDENGGYGHPDHIMAHRVAMAAVERAAAGDPAWAVERVYWITAPRSALEAELAAAAAQAPPELLRVDADALPSTPDDVATTVVDGSAHVPAVLAALAAHATQVSVHGGCYALYDRIARHVSGREYFRRVHGDAAGPIGPDGLEQGLFAPGGGGA